MSVTRRIFIASAAATIVAGGPSGARALVETTLSGRPITDDAAHATLEAVALIAATQFAVRMVWRPPSSFPAFAPIAYYAGHGDVHYPNEPVIWLNPDHPELISPRASNLTDEIPLFTELLLASVDVHPSGVKSLGLEKLDPDKRRAAAEPIAAHVAVVARYSPYVVVDDTEFARRRFAFAVLRQMTPGIGGVAPLVMPASMMPREEPYAYYAGRDVDPQVPRGWGVIRMVSPDIVNVPAGYDGWLRAFVLATADQQPAGSDVRRAHDDARARDEANPNAGDRWAARRAFAAPYVAQVAALFGR